MIGPGLMKLAKENGMTLRGDVAYGSLRGYAATLSEGIGYKKIDFAVSFPDMAHREALRLELDAGRLKKLYRVTNISMGQRVIQVRFHDNPGTMKRLRSFLDWFIPRLEEYRATGAECCAECGAALSAARWIWVHGICYPVHEACAVQVQAAVEGSRGPEAKKAGSYCKGAAGALIAALLGAVMWAVILNAGYIAALAGMLIGLLADRDYRMTGGRAGKGKTAILILSVMLSVVLGTFGSDVMEIGRLIQDGSLSGFSLWEAPVFILALLVNDAGYRAAALTNLGKGLFFAGLGGSLVLMQGGEGDSPVFQFME